MMHLDTWIPLHIQAGQHEDAGLTQGEPHGGVGGGGLASQLA